MKPLFSLLTAIRMIYPLNNRATVIIPAIILATTTICRAQIQEPPKPKTPNTQIKDPIPVSSNDILNAKKVSIKNIGQGAIDLKRASVSGTIEKPNNIYVSGGCGFPVYMLLAPKSLAPGESYSSSFPCSSDLISGQQYVYILTVGSTYEVPESNTTNNTASVQFTKP